MNGSRLLVHTYTYMDCNVREASFSRIHKSKAKNPQRTTTVTGGKRPSHFDTYLHH
ncbi:unnamed protein product [Chondrus crispus]|uniref:Uncharacterized protein n=1 Tax=Chondrus crispus TaxID=2769 RepID=R7QQ07_CHOCR|nr:unnamed protein product [Chondrus crispus]CDF40199.1 unnamed protein product [Chondrus crispus]|eukprot:XP_005710493.1 unnamed protein product [Chondrus crispus]